MERPDYYDPQAAQRPPPQLTRAELQAMRADDVTRADEAGQFECLKQFGRDPIDAERRGERWATPDEAQAALQAEATAAANQRQANRAAARNEGLEV
jgi:hypothetical protein